MDVDEDSDQNLELCWICHHGGLTLYLLVLFADDLCKHFGPRSGPEAIKLFSYSTQPSTKFLLLINVKMPTIVGILTFISMIYTTSERWKARNFFICRYFSFLGQLKFRAQFS